MATPPRPQQYSQCPACGHRIVTAVLANGRPIALDTGIRTYRLVLCPDNHHYKAEASSGYPAHMCRGEKDK